MHVALGIIGLSIICILLLDIFQAVVLARRARGEFRLTHAFYRATWPVFAGIGRRTESGKRREAFLGIYGPLSLLLLFFFWGVSLVVSFALIRYSMSPWNKDLAHFSTDVYQSASSFLTVGAGETPRGLVRWINVIEAGMGLSFLALVIGYLPVFYQSFARRELHISLLDARAGSPPSASGILSRQGKFARQLESQLAAWEGWVADLMQDELSYPMLAYFRSQHVNQSWVTTLVAITDASALIALSAKGELKHQAEVTFAMGRHALIDTTRALGVKPGDAALDRLRPAELRKIRETIINTGAAMDASLLPYARVAELMTLYEPYCKALSDHLLMALPALSPREEHRDNWQIAPRKPGQEIFAVSDPFQDTEDESA